MRTRQRAHGLTLIEVLVALAVWALLAALTTRGLDLMLKSQSQQKEREDAQFIAQTALDQWRTDLNQMDTSAYLPVTLDWNGRVLRLLRYSTSPTPGERIVVAWGLRQNRWVRWQSRPLTRRDQWQATWDAALAAYASDSVDPSPDMSQTLEVSNWRVFYYRNDSWSNPLSSTGAGSSPVTPATPTVTPQPDGIRLQLDLTPRGPWQGQLQWDWVRPDWSAQRS